MANTDVLVCGKCHKVFNFIEQFIEHREEGCTEKSSFRESVCIIVNIICVHFFFL